MVFTIGFCCHSIRIHFALSSLTRCWNIVLAILRFPEAVGISASAVCKLFLVNCSRFIEFLSHRRDRPLEAVCTSSNVLCKLKIELSFVPNSLNLWHLFAFSFSLSTSPLAHLPLPVVNWTIRFLRRARFSFDHTLSVNPFLVASFGAILWVSVDLIDVTCIITIICLCGRMHLFLSDVSARFSFSTVARKPALILTTSMRCFAFYSAMRWLWQSPLHLREVLRSTASLSLSREVQCSEASLMIFTRARKARRWFTTTQWPSAVASAIFTICCWRSSTNSYALACRPHASHQCSICRIHSLLQSFSNRNPLPLQACIWRRSWTTLASSGRKRSTSSACRRINEDCSWLSALAYVVCTALAH